MVFMMLIDNGEVFQENVFFKKCISVSIYVKECVGGGIVLGLYYVFVIS